MSKWFAEQKRSRLEKFQAEQLLKVGPARMEQERLKLKKRIQRYMGELEFPHNKYEDLEKTRIVFRALDAYYSRRHGTNEKFMALVSAGYSNPIEVVAHFWLGESIEVRNALFAKCVLHSADVFGNDPQRLHEWVRAFETTEAFNDFFGVKRGEDRKRRAVSD
ncbi:hypothetical protein AAVH_02238 [Aphelenchoides avenae]|nr:hypothetical protein AAVH_02238 [Aphelenchus avenae]